MQRSGIRREFFGAPGLTVSCAELLRFWEQRPVGIGPLQRLLDGGSSISHFRGLSYSLGVDSPKPPALDAAIREALARGDRKTAVRMVMESYGRRVFSFCQRMTRDRTLAADVYQETLEQACRDIDSWGQLSSLQSWLFGIANHRCLDALRVKRRGLSRFATSKADLDIPAPSEDPAQRLDGLTRARALEQCLAQAGPELRTLLLLRFQQDLSYEDLARIFGEKSDTLRARLVRAFPALRSCLEKKGIQP
jgi:RNA polymerase sigma-70 factor (ECF subfamily)